MSFLIIGKAWTPLLLRLVDAEHVDVELTVMLWEPEGPGEGGLETVQRECHFHRMS